MKRTIASFLIVLQCMFFVLPMQSFALDETTTIIVHYQETEGNEKDWNLWIWPSGGEGSVYEFTEEDNFGKVATFTLSGSPDSVGFIVRTESWEKDTPNDRFIDQFDNGVAEIWVVGGQEAFTYENPNGPDSIQDEAVDLTVHYNRYEDNYDDLSIMVYADGSDMFYDLDLSSDDFGMTGQVTIDDTKDHKEIVIDIVSNGEVVESFGVKKIVNGEAAVFLVENNERVFYAEADAVYKPVVTEAKLNDTTTVLFGANMPFIADEDSLNVLVNGKKVEVSLVFDSYNDEFLMPTGVIKLKEKVAYTDELVIQIPKFDDAKVQLGDVYDTLEFNTQFTYEGDDLGPVYSDDSTTFKVWAPTAQDVNLVLYDDHKSSEGQTFEMSFESEGVWSATVEGDLHNQLYVYAVKHQNTYEDVVDPYAKGVSVNGLRSAVIDLDRTNPDDWDDAYKTNFTNPVDAIMYEIHVRDLSMHGESNIENKGLFLGFTELNTETSNGFSTGLSYIKDLGITHIQFMPIYDYGSVNEAKDDYDFNWGYDPVNYNALEGSYASDPFTPDVRINEFKQVVQTIHDQDLKVTMDVVYNHVYSLNAMAFEKLVPGYYFRKEDTGSYANGSGCGNETASERPMVRKFMVESVTYLADEYNLDGFRFDLMGLHDVETMNQVRAALDEIDPSITIIGEGWNMGNVLASDLKANQNQAHLMPGIAHFNDTIRDGLKGSVFDQLDQGFVNGKTGMSGVVYSGVLGGIQYNEYSTWGDIEPSQSVTYVEAHDNNTLFDKLNLSNPEDNFETITKMHLLADSIVLTSQGVSFIHAGQEFMRTKFGDENSYKSSDIINRLDWTRREKNDHIVQYFKGLIELRKTHDAFRMPTKEMITEQLITLQASDNVIAYQLLDANDDEWENIVVIHNANRESTTINLPNSGQWSIVVNGDKAGVETLSSFKGDSVEVDALNTMVLYYDGSSHVHIVIFILGFGVLALGILLVMKKKKK